MADDGGAYDIARESDAESELSSWLMAILSENQLEDDIDGTKKKNWSLRDFAHAVEKSLPELMKFVSFEDVQDIHEWYKKVKEDLIKRRGKVGDGRYKLERALDLLRSPNDFRRLSKILPNRAGEIRVKIYKWTETDLIAWMIYRLKEMMIDEDFGIITNSSLSNDKVLGLSAIFLALLDQKARTSRDDRKEKAAITAAKKRAEIEEPIRQTEVNMNDLLITSIGPPLRSDYHGGSTMRQNGGGDGGSSSEQANSNGHNTDSNPGTVEGQGFHDNFSYDPDLELSDETMRTLAFTGISHSFPTGTLPEFNPIDLNLSGYAVDDLLKRAGQTFSRTRNARRYKKLLAIFGTPIKEVLRDNDSRAVDVAAANTNHNIGDNIDEGESKDGEKNEDTSLPDFEAGKKRRLEILNEFGEYLRSPNYQPGDLEGAMRLLNIHSSEYATIPSMHTDPRLEFWQITGIAHVLRMIMEGTTGAMLIADDVGLGKTLQNIGIIAAIRNEYVRRYSSENRRKIPNDKFPKKGRPSLVIVRENNLHQWIEEIKKMAPLLDLVIYHGDKRKNEKFLNWHSDIFRKDPIIQQNTVFISTYETFTRRHGPSALKNHRIRKGFTTAQAELNRYTPPKKNDVFKYDFSGRFNFVFLDDCHVVRNPDSDSASTMAWLRDYKSNSPAMYILSSATPLVAGISDISGYLQFASKPEYDEGWLKGDNDFRGQSNPYTLSKEDPKRYLQLSQLAFKIFRFGEYTGRGHQASDIDTVVARIWELMLIRRDYDSAYPIGSDNTICKRLPELARYAVKTFFELHQWRVYKTIEHTYIKDLIKVVGGTSEPHTDVYSLNARIIRLLYLLCLCPLMPYVPQIFDTEMVEFGEAQLDDQTNEVLNKKRRALESSKQVPLGNDLIYTIIKEGCNNYGKTCHKNAPYISPESIPEKVDKVGIVRKFCKWSPKISAMLSFLSYQVQCLGEKAMVWVSGSMEQHIVVSLLRLCDIKAEAMLDTFSLEERTDLENRFNTPRYREEDHSKHVEVLICTYLVRGVGLKLHLDCRFVHILSPTATTDPIFQAIGNNYRLGSKHKVTVIEYELVSSFTSRQMFKSLREKLPEMFALIDHATLSNSVDTDEKIQDVKLALAKWWRHIPSNKLYHADDPELTDEMKGNSKNLDPIALLLDLANSQEREHHALKRSAIRNKNHAKCRRINAATARITSP